MANKNDKQVQELLKKIKSQKEAIGRAEKPNWKTNCSFSYIKDSTVGRVNLQVLSDVNELVYILGFLIEKSNYFTEAAKRLDVNVSFEWMGFTLEEWMEDIQTRINKIQIGDRKKKLEMMETKLNGLISPELRAEMELAEITKMLEG